MLRRSPRQSLSKRLGWPLVPRREIKSSSRPKREESALRRGRGDFTFRASSLCRHETCLYHSRRRPAWLRPCPSQAECVVYRHRRFERLDRLPRRPSAGAYAELGPVGQARCALYPRVLCCFQPPSEYPTLSIFSRHTISGELSTTARCSWAWSCGPSQRSKSQHLQRAGRGAIVREKAALAAVPGWVAQ